MQKTKPDLTVLLASLTDYNIKRNEKGYVADCPACEQEGQNKGSGKLLLTEDGNFSCMRFAGHDNDLRQEHKKDILSALGVGSGAAFRDYTLKDQTVLRVSTKTSRNRHQLALVNNGEVVAVDTVRLDKESDRKKFLKTIDVTGEIKEEIGILLTNIAGRSIEIQDTEEGKSEYTGFFALPDGRVGEMTMEGFAVYDPDSGETEMMQVVENNGTTYLPPRDKVFYKPFDEGIQLPPTVIEYKDDAALMKEIESYISLYVDLPPLERKLAAGYVKFSYIADRVYELPYFRIVGATGTQSRGSGKSRLANVVGRACYRPYKVTQPSAASTYRIMDKYHPTLVIDEFNFAQGSDDAAQMIMILNTGMQRGSGISRVERDELTGEMIVNSFSPFGPKVIAGLSVSDSNAFESRAIRIEMQKTNRKDIESRTSLKQLADGARIRGMMTLWRLRNYSMDIETALDNAEKELKQYAIEPRYVQIATPLYAMLQDDALKQELAMMLVERTIDDAQERQLSPEGTIATVIHSFIFDNNDGMITWADKSLCVEGEPSDLLTIKDITAQYNRIFSDEKPVSVVSVGKRMSKMGLRSRVIERHGSPNYKKSAVVFNLRDLAYHFKQYGLLLPEGIEIPTEREIREEILMKKPNSEKSRDELLAEEKQRRPEVFDAWAEIENGNFEDDKKPYKKASSLKENDRSLEGWTNIILGDKVKKTMQKNKGTSSRTKIAEKSLGNKPFRVKHLAKLTKDEKTFGQTFGHTISSGVKKVKPLHIVKSRVVVKPLKQGSAEDTPKKKSNIVKGYKKGGIL